MDNIYIGCDLHKRTSNLCIKTKDGRELKALKINTTKDAFTNTLKEYGGAHIVFEPVSQSWWLGDILEEMGLSVYLANAREVKAIAHARVKNDKIDAEVLCDLLRGDLLPESHRSSKGAREWKELVRFRTSLIGMRTQIKNKIHGLLGRNGTIAPLGMIFGVKGRAWLKSLELSAIHRTHLDAYLALLDTYETVIAEATIQVESTATADTATTLLMSIPGISYVSALSIMSEVDTVDRFHTGKQIASYAGLVPSVYASGGTIRYGRLTKRGSRTLRTILIEVAHSQGRLKTKTGLRPYFERLKERKGVRTATVATARKLCVLIYHILVSQIAFDDTRMVARMRT
jgi:transposase